MKTTNFPFEAYRRRVHDSGDLGPDLETVTRLMSQQLLHIPFENIDVLNGLDISLQPENLVNKLIHQSRGGYCFELNGLFAMVLDELGVSYRMLAARPLVGGDNRPKTHMALAIELDNRLWLCDLGYGRYGIRQPVDLEQLNIKIQQQDDFYRLSCNSEGIYLLEAEVDGEWLAQIEFDLAPQRWIDFAPANHYTSTHPDSIFVNQVLAILFTEQGRKVLFGSQYKVITGNQTFIRSIDPVEVNELLKLEFNLPPLDRIPRPINPD